MKLPERYYPVVTTVIFIVITRFVFLRSRYIECYTWNRNFVRSQSNFLKYICCNVQFSNGIWRIMNVPSFIHCRVTWRLTEKTLQMLTTDFVLQSTCNQHAINIQLTCNQHAINMQSTLKSTFHLHYVDCYSLSINMI